MVQSLLNFGKSDSALPQWICLDLDGTLILKDPLEGSFQGRCHPELIQTLHLATTFGWKVAIITGRTLSFALQVLSPFQFPYFLAVQQGSHLFSMPDKKLLIEHMIEPSLVQKVLTTLLQVKIPSIAYLGYAKGDACIYSDEYVNKPLAAFYRKIEKLSLKPWIHLPSLEDASTYSSSLIKSFSHDEKELQEVQKLLHQEYLLATTIIKDPLCLGQFYLLITSPKATKGNIVKELISQAPSTSKIIGAGDDLNDLSMLNLCHDRLVMDDAPEELKRIATSIVSSKDPLDLASQIHHLTKNS